MTIDAKWQNPCDHRYVQEITLEGSSPNYFADLDYLANSNLSTVCVMDANVVSPTALFGMNPSSLEGITNFYISADNTQIIFGAYPVAASQNFPNPNENHVPADKYFCSYIAQTANCPKCGGTKIVKDMFLDNLGRISTVSGPQKVQQQILKALLTIQGLNIYDPGYGSLLETMVGSRVDSYMVATLNFSILDCLTNLSKNQQANNLPANETITAISSVNATLAPSDPRIILVSIVCTLASSETVSTNLPITLS